MHIDFCCRDPGEYLDYHHAVAFRISSYSLSTLRILPRQIFVSEPGQDRIPMEQLRCILMSGDGGRSIGCSVTPNFPILIPDVSYVFHRSLGTDLGLSVLGAEAVHSIRV